ncbi:hypothetical protein HPP92_023503 [Vanilla planifolia]|uniref:PLATZ transcription factor family protein n=1 Tax=Vanilla planifolia TaxID=51239 RepID=A0A835PNK7_VANPL|nr:hypothetical protein HPP92_023503 [Vanilla planifolia]
MAIYDGERASLIESRKKNNIVSAPFPSCFFRHSEHGSPVLPMEKEDLVPPWLMPLLRASFFIPCAVHISGNKSECNLYCLDCICRPLCSSCLPCHAGHHIVQIRKSSYHNVIRVSELSKFLDISGLQTYVINGAKVVFLNERPQPRPCRGLINACESCFRGLPDSHRFCSVGCKVHAMKKDPTVAFSLCGKVRWSESEGTSRPRKRVNAPAAAATAAGSAMDIHGVGLEDFNEGDFSRQANVPVVDHRRRSRRKGVPNLN